MAIDLKYGDRFTYTSYTELSKVATDREIRREYTRLRDIAQKRVKRLGNSEFNTNQAYKQNAQGFLKLSQMKKKGSLDRGLFSREIKKMVAFLSASTSTVKGAREQRKKAIDSLHKAGYYFVNQSNINTFGEFMAEFRAEYGRNARGSNEAAELYESMERAGIDPLVVKGEFSYWLENREEISNMDVNATMGSADYVRELLSYYD